MCLSGACRLTVLETRPDLKPVISLEDVEGRILLDRAGIACKGLFLSYLQPHSPEGKSERYLSP